MKLNTTIVIDEIIRIGSLNYELVGVIHHHGNYISSGHYTSSVKFDKYYMCNDTHIKPSQYSDIKFSNTAYMIFYKKKLG